MWYSEKDGEVLVEKPLGNGKAFKRNSPLLKCSRICRTISVEEEEVKKQLSMKVQLPQIHNVDVTNRGVLAHSKATT